MKNITDKPSTTDKPTSRPYASDKSHILGWAIDANTKNDPTYPMRRRSKEDTKSYDWKRPSLQAAHTEILHSNERPGLTAVFGTSAPLSGLSGIIRRFAFKYSEGKIYHWLALLLADRVNMVEGLVADISQGHLPNVLTESGIKAEWKHNPKAVITKAVIGAAIVTSIFLLLKHKRNE